MWLFFIAAAFFAVGVILAFTGAGVFSIVLIPLGLIAFGVAFTSSVLGWRKRSAEGEHSASPGEHPLPHTPPEDSGQVLTTPEGLADARRAQQ